MKSLVLIALTVFSAALFAQDKTEFIVGDQMEALNLPFSDAARVGDIIFMSGTLGVTPKDFKLVNGGITAETHQIFANMKSLLEANNSSLNRIFKCTVMMDDIAEWPKFNSIYVTYFPGDKPARSAFGANGLALGAAVEMECWATVND
jgi:reactive intermediate/imine deaminase